jgi:purine-binding chemotaxis protein CheW
MKKKVSFKRMLKKNSSEAEARKQKKGTIRKENEEEKRPKTPVAKTSILAKEEETKEEEYIKLVLFRLGNEFYGIPVSMIDEIIETELKETVAGMPDFIVGVIFLRKESIPVLSLYNRFNLDIRSAKNQETVLITKQNSKTFGILIDELKEVIDIEPDSIFDVPHIFPEEEYHYIKGMIKYQEEIAAIIDIKRILSEI